MVMLSATSSSPLVSVIVPVTLAAKLIVSDGNAAAIAARSEPTPLSLRLVTRMAEGSDNISERLSA